MIRQALIEAAFLSACEDELAAPKPGNVHVFADGHGMTTDDFRASAASASGPLCRSGAGLGQRILDAVAATKAAVGQNTNLGIVLLAAPLAMAAERGMTLRSSLVSVLAATDVADADLAFRAIVLAAPGGLGEAPRHDVRAAAQVTLMTAMAEAAGRDRIAYQWTHAFADIFERGMPTLDAAAFRYPEREVPALAVFLDFLAAFPDSHVQRKFGADAAEALRQEAGFFRCRLAEADALAAVLPDLLDWDASLKARGLNPGTTADLTVATIFASRLGTILRGRGDDG